MGKFIDIIKKGISFGAVEPDTTKSKPKGSKVTNKILLKELTDHFNEQMEELSVGRRILYPMSFNILLHPDDYNATKESLPFVLPEVVASFYASIKRKKEEFVSGVNFAAPATDWFFQFSACQVTERDGKEDFIKRGEVITTGNLTHFDIHKAQQNGVRTEANVHLSVKCQNSSINDNNINMEALLGMEILSEGIYSFQFDKNLNEDTTLIVAASDLPSKGLATLRWAGNDGHDRVFDMHAMYIEISGKADKRSSSNICHIDSDAVSTQHVQIKYEQATQTFSLAAYGKVRLNSREVPVSVGGNPQWVPLAKSHSKIFINDSVSVEFNANPELV